MVIVAILHARIHVITKQSDLLNFNADMCDTILGIKSHRSGASLLALRPQAAGKIPACLYRSRSIDAS